MRQSGKDTAAKLHATQALNAIMKNGAVKTKGINQRQLRAITEASSASKEKSNATK